MVGQVVPTKQAFILIMMFLPLFLASNILFLPLYGEGSHYCIMTNIGKELAQRGHNVTILVGSIYEKEIESTRDSYGPCSCHTCSDEKGQYNVINFEFFKSLITRRDFVEHHENMTTAGVKGKYVSWLTGSRQSDFNKMRLKECESILDTVSRFRSRKFDLFVFDMSHKCPLAQYFRQQLRVTIAAVSATLAIPGATYFSNNWHFNPSYMPEFTSGLDQHMTFGERSINTALFLYFFALFSIFGTKSRFHDADLFLVNTNFALDFARPLPLNTIAVGGLTVEPKQQLSDVSI